MRPKERRREWAERSVPGAARPDRRCRTPACEARQGDRLAVSRGPVRSGLFGQSRASAAADAAHGGPGDLSSRCTTCRTRTCARAGPRTPTFRLFCGEEFFRHKTPFDCSSLTRWRQRMGEEKLCRADPGEPCDRDANRRGYKPWTSSARHRRHDGAVEGGGVLDRRQAHAPGAGASGLAGEEDRRFPAPGPRAGRQACADRPSALRPRYKQFKRANRALRIRTYLGRVRPRSRSQDERR